MISRRSSYENNNRQALRNEATDLLKGGVSLNTVSLLTLERQAVSRILYYEDLYRRIVSTPGVICEFGVQYGSTLNLLVSFRGMYEPYNVSRKIYGFDTFEGFLGIDDKDFVDTNRDLLKTGDYSVPANHQQRLERILHLAEAGCPVSHLRKFELIRGDASKTFLGWLNDHPSTVISMAIFDMDLYKPTRDVLEKVTARLVRGSLLVFDEFSCASNPGEARAVLELLDLHKLKLYRHPHQSYCAWCVWGE